MKNILINNIILNIEKSNNYSREKLLEIKYGLETLYLTITKTIVVLIISLLLNTTYELLLFIIFYGLLKLNGFGLHAKKSWQCWITSIPIFALIPWIIKNIYFNYYLYYSLPLLIILIAIYAPADTEKRPLINKKKRIRHKVLSILTSITYSIIILLTNNIKIKICLFLVILLQVIVINPLSYKLFGLPYKNYKVYKMKGGK